MLVNYTIKCNTIKKKELITNLCYNEVGKTNKKQEECYELSPFYHRRALLSTGILQKRLQLLKNCGIDGAKCKRHIERTAAQLHTYLTTGSFDKNETKGDFNSAIHPIVGRYISNSESNDQCRIASFSIRIDVDANGQFDYMKSINILTEFHYQIDEYYYCLPNIGRSNFDWWIDPLVVSVNDFDSIFSKEGE